MFDTTNSALDDVRESVRRFAAGNVPKFRRAELYNTVPRELFESLASIGATGLTIAEQYGGAGLGARAASVTMEELARVDLGPAIFLGVHLMIAGLIGRHGSEDQKQRYLPRLAAGEMLGAFGLTEPRAGSDAAALATTARKTDDGYELNGEKCYITSAGFADLYVIFAREPGTSGNRGISAFLVEKNSQGFSAAPPEKKMGCELSPIASVSMQNTPVPRTNLLGAEGGGYAIALSALAGGRVNIASSAVGMSRAAIDLASHHLSNREQFGRKLIEFQGLQFMLADMKMKLDAAALLTAHAAAALETDRESKEARIAPSVAKCFATDAAMSITTDAVQMLGGAGYIKDYDVERLMRDAKMLQIVEGTNQIQRLIIAREMTR